MAGSGSESFGLRRLPDALISKIAAGEVVERPSSVVKELVENALDAAAGRIEIELENGGRDLISVADDGGGIAAEDAPLALERHATSKIASFEDLLEVATLGFRGEALASIAAVSKCELLTARSAGDGHRLVVEGGRLSVDEPVSRPRGTTVTVESLFYNVPARKQFLKRPATELRHALTVVQGYALARPDVTFVLRHAPDADSPGRELLRAQATGVDGAGRLNRIAQLFGEDLVNHLTPLPEARREQGISGFVGDRETTKGRRLFLFVNGRLLRDRAVLGIYYKAVRDLMKGDRPPALFLFLDVPPESVDVNVHPQKAEVRFRDAALLGRVGSALRRGLEAAKGEEPAPLRELGGPVAPPAWTGAGQLRETAAAAWRRPGAAGEDHREEGAPAPEAPAWAAELAARYGGTQPGPAGKLAEVAYRPRPSRPVRLSGKARESLRLIGQYKGTMILLEGPESLLVVDQHVAHERILYERFRHSLAERQPASQTLLVPRVLELSAAENAALGECSAGLERCGYSVSSFSGGSAAITAIPAVLPDREAESLVLRIATRVAGGDELPSEGEALGEYLLTQLAASRACRAAVKMHEALSMEKMESLIAELFACEHPYTCPHGRPVVLELTDRDLERRFKRR
ncbi:MAG: DNA mismatch repair endonuclease MutL [Acidobacteriota bacterium]|nr:DNA mismatch repair endonuclease MutL [Acidobacteriota bacterium]